MAAGQHKLSRRALLGAALAPALVRHSGLDPEPKTTAGQSIFSSPSPQARWIPDQVRDDEKSRAVTIRDRALARLQEAQAALDSAARTPDEDLYDRFGARHDRALRRLLRTPAPDLPALAAKVELALDERTLEFAGDAAAMKALKRDARRLASTRSAPPGRPRQGRR